MRRTKPKPAEAQTPLLFYRRNDGNPLFGAAVLNALHQAIEVRSAYTDRPSPISERLAGRYPSCSFRRNRRESPFECFNPVNYGTQTYATTLLIPCDEDFLTAHQAYSQSRGYLIDSEQQQFSVLHGSHMGLPTDDLLEQLNRPQRQYIYNTMSNRDQVYFPYGIEKTYSLDALPPLLDFLNDILLHNEGVISQPIPEQTAS